MYKYFLIFALLIGGAAFGQWTEPDTSACPQPGPGTQAPWISNDNLRLYVSSPGQIAVFTRNRPNSEWGELQIFSSHINATATQRCPAESPSGDTLYWVGAARDDCENYGSWDVYYAIRTDTGWGQVFNAGANVNSARREYSVGISRDGSLLLVASNRSGAFEADLYYHEKQADGSWGPAFDFGPAINDVNEGEEHPCLSPDNNALYFSHRSVMLGDIWKSQKIDGVWQQAGPLPSPPNNWPTVTGEEDPCLAMDGRTLYYRWDYTRNYDYRIAVSIDTSASAAHEIPATSARSTSVLSVFNDSSGGLRLIISGYRIQGEHEVKVYDILGRLINSFRVSFNLTEGKSTGKLASSSLPSGTYFLELNLPSGALSAKYTVTE